MKLAPGKMERRRSSAPGKEPKPTRTAVALAQAHTGRHEVIALPARILRGDRFSGRSLTANSGKCQVVPTQVAAGVKHAHAPYCYRCPFGLLFPSCEVKCARDIEELIQTTTVGEVAKEMIAEPILGVGGVIVRSHPGWI